MKKLKGEEGKEGWMKGEKGERREERGGRKEKEWRRREEKGGGNLLQYVISDDLMCCRREGPALISSLGISNELKQEYTKYSYKSRISNKYLREWCNRKRMLCVLRKQTLSTNPNARFITVFTRIYSINRRGTL